MIEPSAGDGAFYKNIEHDNKIGIDIDPQHDEIIKCDWFNYNISEVYQRVLVIGESAVWPISETIFKIHIPCNLI